MGVHAFVDEAKRPGYLIVAALVSPTDLADARRALRSLLLGNQRRIHFKDEREARKRQILKVVVGLPLTVRVYACATSPSELEARRACLRQLIPDLAAVGAARLVIERDDSLLVHDRQTLYDAVEKAGCRYTLTYQHLRAYEETLLWAADTVAWCWSHGTGWQRHVQAIVEQIIEVG